MKNDYRFDCLDEFCDLVAVGTFSEVETVALAHRSSAHWGIISDGHGEILNVMNQTPRARAIAKAGE